MAAARSTKPATDMTGRKTEELLRQQAEEDAEVQERLGMANRLEKEHDANTVIDYSDPNNPKEVFIQDAAPKYDDAVEVVEYASDEGIDINVPMRTVKINTTMDRVMMGYGNYYNFVAGRRYTLPEHVCELLDEKGYVS